MHSGRAQLLALAGVAATQAFSLRPRATQRTRLRAAAVEEFDVVVIGSGIGGLSCAGLLAAAALLERRRRRGSGCRGLAGGSHLAGRTD